MVNREARKIAKSLIERFLAGEITNDEFCKKYPPDPGDLALANIYERLWFYWDDIRTHTLSGKHELSPEGRALFELCIAFLGSDLEYEWPRIKWIKLSNLPLRLLGLRKFAEKRGEDILEEFKRAGDFEVWPFLRQADYLNSSQGSSSARG